MKSKFVGREAELDLLRNESKSDGGAFTVVYGRRRLGKTTLIRQFLKNHLPEGAYLYCLVPDANEALVLRDLSERISPFALGRPASTLDFSGILSFIEKAASEIYRTTGRKFTLVLDEFPRLVQANPSIASMIQGRWDSSLKDLPFHLIACGSSISMMESIFYNNRAPLFGRRTSQIALGPLSLSDLKSYFELHDSSAALYLYGLIGGTPYYWESFRFDRTQPMNALIAENFFSPQSIFQEEGYFLLREETKEPKTYLGILEEIARGAGRLGNLSNRLGLKTSDLAPYLETLQRLHYLRRDLPVFYERGADYTITDPFIQFWFKFVRPNLDLLELRVPGPDIVRQRCQKMLGDHFAGLYEQMWRFSIKGYLGSDWLKVGKLLMKDRGEIDVAGVTTAGDQFKLVFAAEVKFSKASKPFDMAQLNKNIHAAAIVYPRLDIQNVLRVMISPTRPKDWDAPNTVHLTFPDETLLAQLDRLREAIEPLKPTISQDSKGAEILNFDEWGGPQT